MRGRGVWRDMRGGRVGSMRGKEGGEYEGEGGWGV